jgi:hypothetical protein
MGLLPWSFGFLLIISILSWSAIGRMSEETLVTQSIITSVHQQAAELTKKIASKSAAAYRQYCEKNGKSAPDCDEEEEEEDGEPNRDFVKRLRTPRSKRPLTSKLHLRSLFSNEDQGQKDTQEKIFRNLLRVLYASQPLFSQTGTDDAQLQQLFEEVRLKAIEVGPKFPMTNASFLANLELTGYKKESKQFLLFLLLKGGKGEFFRGRRCYVRPLLSYISMNKKECCMGIYLAPVPLLLALFEKEDIVEKIVEYRTALHKKILKEKENNSTLDGEKETKDIIEKFSEEFKSQFESSIPPGIDVQYIDFRVSTTAPKNF